MRIQYKPIVWCILSIKRQGFEPFYKVLAGWGDDWRLNSGITNHIKEDGRHNFMGVSGSIYSCEPQTYGVNELSRKILTSVLEKADKEGVFVYVMPEETDWDSLKYLGL